MVDRLCDFYESTGRLDLGEGLFEEGEFGLLRGTRTVLGEWGKRGDGFAAGDGENIELVIDDEAGGAVAEREDEALVETGDNIAVGFGAVARVDIL